LPKDWDARITLRKKSTGTPTDEIGNPTPTYTTITVFALRTEIFSSDFWNSKMQNNKLERAYKIRKENFNGQEEVESEDGIIFTVLRDRQKSKDFVTLLCTRKKGESNVS